uniref:Hydrogenase accessory protein HypB n=1 Tax=Chlorobium chlorochromatii (strain CaD3) TaxID=340177 RepID=Q3AT68_CHLCH
MCDSCGCSGDGGMVIRKPSQAEEHHHEHAHHSHHHADHHHSHEHGEEHSHSHSHEHSHARKVVVEQDVLLKNNLLAERNRGYFDARSIYAINLLSSPGSGKTSLLERLIPALQQHFPVAVIEGDQQTTNDADRLHALGISAIQINTGSGCHLDADMVNRAIKQLELKDHSLLCIENVGNLVCPAMFDLGEALKIVVISVTEGEDKPLKYPAMFHAADVCIVNKIDLLPYVDFNVERCKEYAMQVNHHLQWFEVSAKSGDGLAALQEWLEHQVVLH